MLRTQAALTSPVRHRIPCLQQRDGQYGSDGGLPSPALLPSFILVGICSIIALSVCSICLLSFLLRSTFSHSCSTIHVSLFVLSSSTRPIPFRDCFSGKVVRLWLEIPSMCLALLVSMLCYPQHIYRCGLLLMGGKNDLTVKGRLC